jgi:hypothetical protein
MAWEIQNVNGLVLADIHFDRNGNVGEIEWQETGVVYTDEEELEIDLALAQGAGYDCEVIFVNGANRRTA